MNTLLNDRPTWLLAIIVIGGCTGIAIDTALIPHSTIRASMREMHNDVADYVFAVIGVLYALLLGFIIIATRERIGSAEADVQVEAASLTDLYKTSVALPVGMRQQAEAEVRRYTSLITTVGWPALAHGEFSPGLMLRDAVPTNRSRSPVCRGLQHLSGGVSGGVGADVHEEQRY